MASPGPAAAISLSTWRSSIRGAIAAATCFFTLGPSAGSGIAGDASISLDEDALRVYARAVRAQGVGGVDGWVLTDHVTRLALLDNERDARDALAVGQRHTAQCWIGRTNSRANRLLYIMQYWAGDSGAMTTVAHEDCLPYDPAHLAIVKSGSPADWILTDGTSRISVLSSQADAKDALAIARTHTTHCFIGRANQRAERQAYVMEYWVGDTTLDGSVAQADCYSYRPEGLRVAEEHRWTWSAVQPEFHIRASGVTLAGQMRVTHAGVVTDLPFELLTDVSFQPTTGRLRLSVADTPVTVTVSHQGAPLTLGSVALGSYYSTSLLLRGVFRPGGGVAINALPSNVSIQLLEGSLVVTGDASYE